MIVPSLLIFLLALTLGPLAPGASAHERRTVAGRFNFVVGFLTEPAIIDQPNGVSLAVTDATTSQPVSDVEKTLKVEIATGGQSKTYELKTRFNMPGAYSVNLIPTKSGTWTFRFFGEIAGTQINERFESGPGRFNDVENSGELQFPVKTSSLSELTAQVQRLSGPAEAGAATAPATLPASVPDVQRALDEAKQARTLALGVGVTGVVVGLVGVALAAVALSGRRRSGPSSHEPV